MTLARVHFAAIVLAAALPVVAAHTSSGSALQVTSTAFAGVRWERIVIPGLVLGFLYRLYFWKRKLSLGVRGLIYVILWGVAWMILVVLLHDSPVIIEVTAAISLGLVIEALLGQMWSRRSASESGAKRRGEDGASSSTRPFDST
jgi:hypothetical protein